jgi:transposase-like protein
MTTDKALDFAFETGLLHQSMTCDSCRETVTIIIEQDKNALDGVRFWCRQCKRPFSIRRNSIFWKQRIALPGLISVMSKFLSGQGVHQTADETGLSVPCILKFFAKCRDVCKRTLEMDQLMIGGPGLIVQCDESMMFKRKYNRGRATGGRTMQANPRRWVFGGYCVNQKKGFLFPVLRRNAETLIPLIEAHVVRGSEIHTDKHRAYSTLRQRGWVHKTVNHKANFVDPITGANTQGIESFWSCIKRQLKRVYGSQGQTRFDRLHEYVYRFNYRMTKTCKWTERLRIFAGHVAALYRN